MSKAAYILLLLNFSVILTLPAFGQDKFLIVGRFKVETGKLTRGKIEVEKNGTRDRILIVDGSGKFELKLDFNSTYIISFSQDDYVTKKLSFSTKAPKERIEEGFDPFPFQVTLFKQYDDINTVVFNQPVGQIGFSDEVDDFDYDTDYTQSILKQIREVEAQVKKKQKEEEKEAKKAPKPPREKKPPPPPEDPPKKQVAERTVEQKPQKKFTSTQVKAPPRRNVAKVVVLHAYTVGEYSYPNLPAYGYINFGDGAGNREISKEQYEEYTKTYR